MDIDSFFDITEKAQAGDATSQFELGKCFDMGNIVNQNYNQAVYWYTKAA